MDSEKLRGPRRRRCVRVREEEERKWGERKEVGEICLGYGGAGQSVGAGGGERSEVAGQEARGPGEGGDAGLPEVLEG